MLRFGLTIAAAAIVLDQATKYWIVEIVMDPPRAVHLTSFLSIVMVWNRGVSFGMFNDGAVWLPWIFVGLALAVSAGMTIWLKRVTDRWLAIAIGLIIGGALGNMIDRIQYGAVADFIDFHVGAWHWPAFNVADSAIFVGVAILIIDSLIRRERAPTV